mmetsp:Transcript_12168/g.36860  ORF Transcript_12168/g.36860 Transcript_12168/m.36860 type:complete len:302 (+) Transcript_12168:84-989(+)|eukprot:CAMPEP_0177659890 /NCGR_PEP_ID=MMETSP0447-20121125/17699_1 /TAXON_ID=0 /ORGANISM="Stygamoeba regulata, Strain BSH-02190019" /LENGTH=301 /DNA_ID=CAMNT_0019164821 /DNA_START=25 /DNA_END=930 /DNA_ORIENTATION=+
MATCSSSVLRTTAARPTDAATHWSLSSAWNGKQFQEALQTHSLGRWVLLREQCASTQDVASRELQEGAPHGTLVLTHHQTQGRGRAGRPWSDTDREQSGKQHSLLFSMVLRPLELKQLFKVNLATPLAVAEAASALGVPDVRIKWPNDVWIGSRKVSGVILDTSIQGKLFGGVLGVGINVNQPNMDAFAPELRETATSLRMAAKLEQDISREVFLASVCNRLEHHLSTEMSAVQAAFAKYDMLLGREIMIKPKRREDPEGYVATSLGCTDEGFLRVQLADGSEKLISGEEVMVRLDSGEYR